MKKKIIGTAILAVTLISAGVYVTSKRENIQNKILDAVIKKIGPSLPFKIESYELSKDLKFLRLNLKWNQYVIVIAGDLAMKWHGPANGWTVRYAPEIQIDNATPIHVVLNLSAPTEFKTVNQAELASDPDHVDSIFVWKAFGIDLKKPLLQSKYISADTNAHLELKAESAMWTDLAHDQHAVSLTGPQLIADLRGGVMSAKFKAQGSEVLWDSYYADLPLKELPVSVTTSDQKHIEVVMGEKEEVKISVERSEKENGPTEIAWKTKRVNLAPFLTWVLKTIPPAMNPLAAWSDLELKGGTIRTEGAATVEGGQKGFSLHQAFVDAAKLSLRSASHHLTAKEVSLLVPYREKDSVHSATLEIPQLYFKKISARLKKTQMSWNASMFKTKGLLPLEIQSAQAQIGAIEGKFGQTEKDAYRFTTSLKLKSTNLAFLNPGLCLPNDKLPPAQLQIDFPNIVLSPGVIDPTGKVILDLFKGRVELNEIGFYDLSTEVPEIDFDVDWKDLDMQTMGEWTRFGEIKGTLEGYAKDVVFQSFLPTQYEFFIHVQPLDRTKKKGFVEFSPEAMKNFVKIFTGEDLDEQIPGIAGWLMFGWPSHVFGGYDVQYAGISMRSSDGLILIETLDPPEVVKDTLKHFILYGPRFKMPIRSPNYPLVIDATAMSNFVHQMASRFGSLKGDSENENTPCLPPEL